jgi:hypothetical protein
MTNQNPEPTSPENAPDPDQNPLLNPKFDLSGENPDIKGFLKWLFDPEVDKAFQEAFPINESEQDEN